MAATSLQWKHQELNRLFSQLPDFAGALLVCTDSVHWKKISDALRVLPSQASGSLSFHVVNEGDAISCPQEADVLVVIRKEINRDDAVQLDATEAAVICLCDELPNEQSSCFDLLLTFSEKSVTSTVRGTKESAIHEFSFNDWSSPIGKDEGAENSLIGFWGFTNEDIQAAVRDLPGINGVDGKNLETTRVLVAVVKGGYPDEVSTRDIESAALAGPVIYVPQRDLRKDDRFALYRMGIQAILPVNSAYSEVVAAIRPWLGSAIQLIHGAADILDSELLSLQIHMRRNQYFSPEQESEMLKALRLLVANRIKKARYAREVCASLLIKFPRSFDENIRHRLTVLVSGVVRQKDLVFSCCSAIVVISNDVNKMTARAILRRLKMSADPKWLSGCQANILEARSGSDGELSADNAADNFLRTIFTAAGA